MKHKPFVTLLFALSLIMFLLVSPVSQNSLVLACGGSSSASSDSRGHSSHPNPAQNNQRLSQNTCPVMGGEIDRTLFVDYEGYRVYLCCPDCEDIFTKNAEWYMKRMTTQGVSVERVSKAKQSAN